MFFDVVSTIVQIKKNPQRYYWIKDLVVDTINMIFIHTKSDLTISIDRIYIEIDPKRPFY